MSNQKTDSNKIIYYAFGAVLFIIITLIGTYIFLNDDLDNRGTFGDMFGFANSMFTGLSFVGLLVTILLQRQEIKSQKEDLEKQNTAIHVQGFENTFFHMIDILFQVMEEVYFFDKDRTLKGRLAISMMHFSILDNSREYSAFKEERPINNKQVKFNFSDEERIQMLDLIFYNNKNQLSSYYVTIFNIVKMIDINPFIDKHIYINILISQFSRFEIMMLYYYGLLPKSKNEKMFIEKYNMLKNIDYEDIIFPEMKKYYDQNAFINVL